MEKYKLKLQERINKGSERSLSLLHDLSDFFSNDYLGLAQSMQTAEIHAGSTGSRLISGNSVAAEKSEKFLADFFGSESALIFNSGYDANLGLFSSVPQRGDTVLYDELIHASVRDGIRLSYAKSYAFKHNDTADLQRKIQQAEGTVFVAVESLYSMDGDLSPLAEIAEICQNNKALLIVDEAHSGGIIGDQGKGLTVELGLTGKVFARVFTFGKAYGAHGAAVLGPNELKNYLINFARSFIYTTALPPGQYQTIQSQITQSLDNTYRTKLQENIHYFREILKDKIFRSDVYSPVQIILVPGVEQVTALAKKLQNNHFAVKAILSPTVPEGEERLRICLHSFNTREEIDSIAALIRS